LKQTSKQQGNRHMAGSSVPDFWDNMWRLWVPNAFAPQELLQPINPGWSFGNVTINAENSSAPQTEQAILAQESYGRQIGKLLDAVAELVKLQPDRSSNPAYSEIAKLKTKIDRLKEEAAVHRIEQLRRDLDMLRTSAAPQSRASYRQSIAALRALLEAQPTQA
jgi:hypothetical protein